MKQFKLTYTVKSHVLTCENATWFTSALLTLINASGNKNCTDYGTFWHVYLLLNICEYDDMAQDSSGEIPLVSVCGKMSVN